MKKVLFLSFYWPPSGKASIHWPLKMIKYLPDFGWEPSVLTVKEDTFSAPDPCLERDISEDLKVYKTRFWDPFLLYKKFLGKDTNTSLATPEAMSKTNATLKQKLALWIRLNLFIPDARAGWYLPGVADAKKLLKNEKFDLIISNGPPHTTHLLAKKLKKHFNIPLISVFIDPWVDISYYKGHKRSRLVLKIDNMLEKSVVKESDKVIFVTKGLQEFFENKYSFLTNNTDQLYWGYNEEDFERTKFVKEPKKEKILLHAGNLFDHQNPKFLWKSIMKQIEKGENIKVRFIGTVGPGVLKDIYKCGLTKYTENLGFLEYDDMLKEMVNADYLLVCSTEHRHVPGKLFEYMRTGNPILAFGDFNEEVKDILETTKTGLLYNYKSNAADFFEKCKTLEPDMNAVKNFDRYKIAGNLSEIMNKYV